MGDFLSAPQHSPPDNQRFDLTELDRGETVDWQIQRSAAAAVTAATPHPSLFAASQQVPLIRTPSPDP